MTQTKTKPYKFNPFTVDQNAGRIQNDVEIRFGNQWITVSSISTNHAGSLFWTSDDFIGNSPKGMWRWKAYDISA